MKNPWTTLSTRNIYRNQWIGVREDDVIRPDGGKGIYGVVEVRPSIGVLALNDRGELLLVGQWRYPVNRYSWEIPRGGSHEGETDLQTVAARELREEAGVRAANWTRLLAWDVNNGITDDVEHMFLATGITHTTAEPDPEEEIAVRWVPFPEAVAMVTSGEITEVCTAAAVLLLHALRISPGQFRTS